MDTWRSYCTHAIIFQIAYGAIILTFLGGMAWGWRDDQKNQKINLAIGIAYSLIGCMLLLLMYLEFILSALLISVSKFSIFLLF